MKRKEKTNLTIIKPTTEKVSRYNINITCIKLKNDLKWFSGRESSSSFITNEAPFNEAKATNALIENWWVNS